MIFVNLIVVPLYEVANSAKLSSTPFSWSSSDTVISHRYFDYDAPISIEPPEGFE